MPNIHIRLRSCSRPVSSSPATPPPPRANAGVAITFDEPFAERTGHGSNGPLGDRIASTGTIELEGGVLAVVDAGVVTLPGWITLGGWLEVAVCRQGTREHESVVATTARPSIVHAALLLAGLEPGRPARYRPDGTFEPASGGPVEISIRFDAEEPAAGEMPLGDAILDERGDESVDWLFAGSTVHPNPPSLGPGEYYAADYAGTIVGLTTFGDEVVAAREARSPEIGIDLGLEGSAGVLPPIGMPVTVIIRRPGRRPTSRRVDDRIVESAARTRWRGRRRRRWVPGQDRIVR